MEIAPPPVFISFIISNMGAESLAGRQSGQRKGCVIVQQKFVEEETLHNDGRLPII